MSVTTQMQVAEEVKVQIIRAATTPRKVALALGWQEPYLYRRLRSEVSFSIDDLEAIAGHLGVSVADFIPAVVRSEVVRPLNFSGRGDVNQRYRCSATPTRREQYAPAA